MATKLSRKALISAFFIGCLFTFSTAASPLCPRLEKYSTNLVESDTVQWVVDGDTIHTGSGKKLRLLHINAPEINPKSIKPAEYFANQSRQLLAKLVPKGSKIFLHYDQKRKDKYGRELVLLFDSKGTLVNLELVKQGAASTLVVPPNDALWRCFKSAQASAEKNQLGLWNPLSQTLKSANSLNNERGFQWVIGKITQVKESKKYRWVILDEKLWVGIKRKDFEYFSGSMLEFKKGSSMKIGGYLYHSYGKPRINLRHPAMFSHD